MTGERRGTSRAIDLVVKLGGGLLAHPDQFAAVLEEIGRAAHAQRLLIVPGGGPFADAVREVDARLAPGDDAAHWMAVLAMDQYAHLVASRLAGSVVVHEPDEVAAAFASGRVPVLAPFRWLRRADPLPHSWDVTSDSIAAWVAGALRAPRLVLVKPPGASGLHLVDTYFASALPSTVTAESVPADATDRLRRALSPPN